MAILEHDPTAPDALRQGSAAYRSGSSAPSALSRSCIHVSRSHWTKAEIGSLQTYSVQPSMRDHSSGTHRLASNGPLPGLP